MDFAWPAVAGVKVIKDMLLVEGRVSPEELASSSPKVYCKHCEMGRITQELKQKKTDMRVVDKSLSTRPLSLPHDGPRAFGSSYFAIQRGHVRRG